MTFKKNTMISSYIQQALRSISMSCCDSINVTIYYLSINHQFEEFKKCSIIEIIIKYGNFI